jgi:antitoxin ParD1/3/4
MATMNISLPDQMKVWVEAQVATGRYANASDYIRDLVRRDQVRDEGISRLQAEIDMGRQSGFSEKTSDEIFVETKRRTAAALKSHNAA